MARGFAKVSEEEIEEAFFYPSDLVNTKTTIPLRVGEERWIYKLLLLRVYCLTQNLERSRNIQATTQHGLLRPSQAFSNSFRS